VNPLLPNPKGEIDEGIGLKDVLVDYDSFFNGKREPHVMEQALRESRKNMKGSFTRSLSNKADTHLITKEQDAELEIMC
jgi:hypothetical protein